MEPPRFVDPFPREPCCFFSLKLFYIVHPEVSNQRMGRWGLRLPELQWVFVTATVSEAAAGSWGGLNIWGLLSMGVSPEIDGL